MAWAGRILRVDLGKGTCAAEPLNMEWARQYLGQRGLATKYFVEEVGGNRRSGNEIWLDVDEGVTVQAVIDQFDLPVKLVHLVLVDGAYVKPKDWARRPLAEGETLAVWPPVAGG